MDATPQPDDAGGERRRGEPTCQNCGARLTGPYCARCGQKYEAGIPTVWELVGRLAGEVFEADSRVWRTLGLLVARPGALTAEYLDGRRATYLPPLRLFMATGIVMLLVYSFSGDAPLGIGDGAGDPDVVASSEPDESAAEPGRERPDGSGAQQADDRGSGGPASGDAVEGADPDSADGDFWSRFGRAVEARVSADPEGVQEAFAENLPRMMFLFLPLAAAMLMGLHPKAGGRYIEHLVFSLHGHAFVFVELAAARSLRAWVVGEDTVLGSLVVLTLVAWTLAYLFLALRRVYGQGRLVTAVKCAVLVVGYAVLLVLMLVLNAVAAVFLA